jgi:hypothetical protein
MPNRILREGIIDSRAVASLSMGAELFYRCLMSIVDDYGRYEADPELLRVKCFPRRLAQIDGQMTVTWLSEVSQALTDDGHPLVTIYECPNGKKYLQINNFRQRIRSEHSKCPSPDGQMTVICQSDDGHPHASRARTRGVVVDVVVGDRRAAKTEPVDSPPVEEPGFDPARQLPPQESPQAIHGPEGTDPGDPLAWMREALIGYMGGPESPKVQEWGLPDDDLCRRCLEAAAGASLELLAHTLREMHRTRGQPSESWGWFPDVIAKFLGRRRPAA